MNQEKVGEFIKKLRIDNNLTQKELADKLGVTYQAVSKWENGKNIPDMAVLKEISNIFNVNIDEIISGEKNDNVKKNKVLPLVIIGILVVLVIVQIVIIINNEHHDFDVKEIGAKCENFKVSGSLVYSKDKSYIYISPITFCGNDDITYDEIECTLYEKYENTISKITSCEKGNTKSIKEYLETVKIDSSNYKSACTNMDNMEIYLEISAKQNDKVTTYKVPLSINNTCSK